MLAAGRRYQLTGGKLLFRVTTPNSDGPYEACFVTASFLPNADDVGAVRQQLFKVASSVVLAVVLVALTVVCHRVELQSGWRFVAVRNAAGGCSSSNDKCRYSIDCNEFN